MAYNLVIFGLAAITGVSAQYKTREIYSDNTCTTLIAIKSEPIELEGDQDNWENDNSGCDSRESCAYMQCLEELEDENAEANAYGVYNCEYVEDEEGFEGVQTYQKEGCSLDVATVSNDNRVLVATYEDGCPGVNYNDDGEDEVELVQYLSMPQQCYPFAIQDGGQRKEEDDKEGENNYNQAELTYSYYAVSCDNGALSTMQCMYSNCTGCVLTTTYIEDHCYTVSGGNGNNDEHDDKDGENKNGMYAQYWCNSTTTAVYYEEDDEEDTDSNMMELPKSAVIAVATVGGALILGLGGALAYQSSDSEDGAAGTDQGSLQSGPDYQRLAN